jgi:hypothetical protein
MALLKHVEIVLPKHQAKLYRRLWASRNDLETAKSYADHILNKRLHSGHIRTKGAYFQAGAFNTALIISYIRAFIDPNDWEKKLLALSLPTTEQLALHKTLKKMRNELFAHSDIRHFDITPGRWGNRRTETVGVTHFELTAGQVGLLNEYISGLHIAVNQEMNDITDNAPASSTCPP